MPVSQVMAAELVTVKPDTDIAEAAEKMADAGVGALPVVDDEGCLVGILEDEHIIVEDARLPEPTYVQLFGAYIRIPGTFHRFEEEFKRLAAANVGEAMDREPTTVSPDATVEDAATYMIEDDLNRLCVIDDDGHLLGLVARIDVVRAISRSGD